jgi:vacuolar-type H+-ATPase subunit I/STV1
MTDPRTRPTQERSPSYPSVANGAAPRGPSGATTGWVRFGAVLMAVVGVFAVIEGLLAFFRPTTYVSSNGVVVAVTFTGWGWLHVILGVLVLAVGLALLREDVPGWARNTAIVLVALNAITQLAWLPAAPIWSIIMIVLDVLIIGALVAIGDRAAWGP